MKRRTLAALSTLALPALAQPAWPARAVRIVIPFTPGGASDIITRPIAARLEALLGQSFVVENRPGGSGAIGANLVANERPDGYTLLLSTPGPLVLLPQMQSGLPYSHDRSFSYIALLGGAPILCAVKGDSPITSLGAYAEAAKRRPDAISFGSSGIGSMGHLTGVLFAGAAGAQLLHAPFRGAPEAQAAILSGSTDSLWDTASANVPAAQAGTLRPLCVSSDVRVAALPNVPTAREAGFPTVSSLNWFMLCAPAGLPEPIAARLAEAVTTVLAEPGIRERMDAGSFVSTAVPRAELGRWVAGEMTRWGPVVRAAGAAG